MRTCWELHPRRILQVSGAISVHGGVSSSESRTRALRPRAEWSSDLPTVGPRGLRTVVEKCLSRLKCHSLQTGAHAIKGLKELL